MKPSQADSQPETPAPGILDRALGLVEFLRARCPWDAAQTPASLQPFLLERARHGGHPQAVGVRLDHGHDSRPVSHGVADPPQVGAEGGEVYFDPGTGAGGG